MPHLHLSLQSGDDLILKRMKRRHSRTEAIAFCAQVKRLRPDVAFGADIIAGFPTETEAMFARSLDLVDACELTFLHAFPYSARQGTPAARMPQVAHAVVKERARRLREAGEAALRQRLASEVGATREVLIESATRGRTEHFIPVAVAGGMPGDVRRLAITGHDGRELLASASSEFSPHPEERQRVRAEARPDDKHRSVSKDEASWFETPLRSGSSP
jgi:threonylcarbamoyladenosine tRNA methylthiotransferase MtaB